MVAIYKTKTKPGQKDVNVIWQPQEGSQELFLSCPIYECLYEGTRGPGKTDALLMDFAQFVGRGYGADWRGILFRDTFPNLEEVIVKSKKWFNRIFPHADYNKSEHRWTFPDGEELLFRYADNIDDYWNYHGHEYPWVGWDELTRWMNLELYLLMMTVCRSSNPDVPRHYRTTCNPYGIGHNAVKARFIDPAPIGEIITEKVIIEGKEEVRDRVTIHGEYSENKILIANDPEYVKNLHMQSDIIRRAWAYGDWDIVAGGMFDDVWNPKVHIVEPFEVPATWYFDRSFDWGSSKPYSVGWWAESDGSDIKLSDGTAKSTQRGDLFRIAEMYGWTGKPNEGTRELATEIARKVKQYDTSNGHIIHAGPADSSIFDRENGKCIAEDMECLGVGWKRADKSPGSRKNGFELLRQKLKNSITKDGPGLYVFDTCRQFIRTVPVLPRDEKNPDDVDSLAEDHIIDECRYRCLDRKYTLTVRQAG
jgi:hypothetical protein